MTITVTDMDTDMVTDMVMVTEDTTDMVMAMSTVTTVLVSTTTPSTANLEMMISEGKVVVDEVDVAAMAEVKEEARDVED